MENDGTTIEIRSLPKEGATERRPLPSQSDLLDRQRDGLAVDVPLAGMGQHLVIADLVAEDAVQQGLFVLAEQGLQFFVAAQGDADVVGDLKAAVLTHGLGLGDQFSDKAFVDQVVGEIGVQNDGDATVGVGNKAVDLGGGDQQVVAGQLGRTAVGKRQGQLAGFVQFGHGFLAVDGGKGGADLAEELAVAGTDGLQLGLEGVGSKGRNVVGEDDFMDILRLKINN